LWDADVENTNLTSRNRPQLALDRGSWVESKGHRLSPEELGLLGKRLAASKHPKEAARLRQRITRGFYGI
jgi:hypothetical protein